MKSQVLAVSAGIVGIILGAAGQHYMLSSKGQLQNNIWGYKPDFVALNTGIKAEYICRMPRLYQGNPAFVFVHAKFQQLGTEVIYPGDAPKVVPKNIPAMRMLMSAFEEFRLDSKRRGWECNLVGPHPDGTGDHRRVVVELSPMQDTGKIMVSISGGAAFYGQLNQKPDGTFDWTDTLVAISKALPSTPVVNYQ